MPIQILCTAVVVRNNTLDKILEGGAENFRSIVPNGLVYGDDKLSQASFMSPVDAEEFCKSLVLRGFQRNDEDPDFVVVCHHDKSVTPNCDWLVIFEWENKLIGTLQGSTSRTVVGPQESRYEDIRHYSAEEIENNFEFVSRENNVDTYRNKETGQLVYHARRTETDDEVFKSAFDIVWQHKREIGHPAKTGESVDRIKAAIESLQKIAAKHSDSPRVYLALGIAWYSIGNNANGIRLLRKAVKLAPQEKIYFKELAGILLTERDFGEAVEVSSQAVVISPDDPELLNEMPQRAAVTLETALRFEPSDKINQNLKQIVADVLSGARPQPKSLEEMMRKPIIQKKKPFWSRWFSR